MINVIKKMYVVSVLILIFFPFLFAHRQDDRVAEDENRYYANVPHLRSEQGNINVNYMQDFEAWINDNVRFRTLFREIKVTILYKLFHVLDLENVGVGINGDLYGASMKDVETVQGRDVLSEEQLQKYENNLFQIQEWLNNQNIGFYYMQCYDKMTIINEQYPKGVVKYDTPFIGEDTESYIESKKRINIVPLYALLKVKAKQDNIYYKYVDWCHWNDAGMYLGYEQLMKTIQKEYPDIQYLKLEEYDIIYNSSYREVYGFRYPLEENAPFYRIMNPKAEEVETDFNSRLRIKEHTHHFKNDTSDKRILIINDSFIRMSMKNHLAENFGECLSVDLTNLSNIEWIIEEYKPDIVLLECLETNIPSVMDMLSELEMFDDL